MYVSIKAFWLSVGLVVAASQVAQAVPVLEFEFLGSGQTFTPTDTVVMRGRVTNVSNEALNGGVGGGSINFIAPVFDEYFDPLNRIQPWPSGVTVLAPGESIEWIMLYFVPWPLRTNVIGDPVLPGLYTFPLSDFTTTFFVPAGPDSFTVTAQKTNASDFIWTVVEEPVEPLSEPSMITLVGLALAGFGLAARKRSSCAPPV